MSEVGKSEIGQFMNRIIQGDCLEVMNGFPSQSVDLVIADPPYNISVDMVWAEKNYATVNEEWDKMSAGKYESFVEAVVLALKRLLNSDGSCYIFGNNDSIWLWKTKMDKLTKFRFRNLITWNRVNNIPTCWAYQGCFSFTSEYILFYVGSHKAKFNWAALKAINSGQPLRDVWTHPIVSGVERLAHPTQKPLKFCERMVIASSNEGDVVLDPFLGSGTTAVACAKLRRKFIGIEINSAYCEVARKRVEPWLNQSRLGKVDVFG